MSTKRAGRPSPYKPEFATQARKLCELGATDNDIAGFFEVHRATIYRWQSEYPEFCDALKVGKQASDDRVERSLYHRATGYTFEAVKIFNGPEGPVYAPYTEHVPPDTTACIFWLKNRRKDAWRDVQRHEVGQAGEFERLSDQELQDALIEQAAKLGLANAGSRTH